MLPWRRRTISENSASQQIDQGLLTFANIINIIDICLVQNCLSQVKIYETVYKSVWVLKLSVLKSTGKWLFIHPWGRSLYRQPFSIYIFVMCDLTSKPIYIGSHFQMIFLCKLLTYIDV